MIGQTILKAASRMSGFIFKYSDTPEKQGIDFKSDGYKERLKSSVIYHRFRQPDFFLHRYRSLDYL